MDQPKTFGIRLSRSFGKLFHQPQWKRTMPLDRNNQTPPIEEEVEEDFEQLLLLEDEQKRCIAEKCKAVIDTAKDKQLTSPRMRHTVLQKQCVDKIYTTLDLQEIPKKMLIEDYVIKIQD